MKKITWKRWILIAVVMSLLIFLIVLKLYDLMIRKGEHYRQEADTKRIKEVEVTAPRGNIYDRNGVLLAGTRTSYVVQGFKDDLTRLSYDERNKVLTSLIQYIERDGADYLDSFPITINAFVYDSKEEYLKKNETPRSYVEKTLRQKNLVGEWLNTVWSSADSKFKVSGAARAITAFSLKGSPLPVFADPDKNFSVSFSSDKVYKEWKEDGRLKEKDTPIRILADAVSHNENLMSQILNHPAMRKTAFETLKKHKFLGKVQLKEFEYTYEDEKIKNKAALHHQFPKIDFNSATKDDFVQIVKQEALSTFLTSAAVDKNNKIEVPAQVLLEKLEKSGIKTNLTFKINNDAESVDIVFKNDEKTQEQPIDRLVKLAKANKVVDEIITDDRFKYIAEQAMFKRGIYPRISVDDWTYGQDDDQKDFKERFDLKDENPQKAYEVIRDHYHIDKAKDSILALGIMVLNSRVVDQGNYAYAPINLCYELSNKTVAMIEENIPTRTGIVLSKEPVRYYPYGDTAAHILGYVGKISTNAEIEKYIKKNHYQNDQLIGKTGIEESFEDTLHGINGKQTVLIDSTGNRTSTVRKVEPQAGNNVYLSIDIKTQLASEKALRHAMLSLQNGIKYYSAWGDFSMTNSPYADSGATVSTNPKTGEVIALASYPTYDPNLFVTGISDSDWNSLVAKGDQRNDVGRPLLNVATQTAVQPGSVFKPLAGLTALEKGLKPTDTITCSGYMTIGDQQFNCLIWTEEHRTHGTITLAEAIGVSCNYFFYVLGLGDDPRGNPNPHIHVTVDDINQMAKKFELDSPTGIEINVPVESTGNIPSIKSKNEMVQSLLAEFLQTELPKYKKKNVFKNKNDVSKDIDQILKLIDKSQGVGREPLIRLIDHLGYNAEEPLPNEYSGIADQIMYDYVSQIGWTQADSLNMMIGQGQNAYTPIEINRYCATIANKGELPTLSLIKEIKTHDNKKTIFTRKPSNKKLELKDDSHWDVIHDGMHRSAEYGLTGMAYENFPIHVGSKTGTAERAGVNSISKEGYLAYSWNMAFAPYDNPQISTTTFLSQAGSSSNAVIVTRDVIGSYLKVKPIKEDNDEVYEKLEDRMNSQKEIQLDRENHKKEDSTKTEQNGQSDETNSENVGENE